MSDIRERVAAVIPASLGREVREVASVGGGSISSAFWCRLDDRSEAFVKLAPAGAPAEMFAQEALSLERLAATRTVRVPAVLATGADWLVLEWLEPAAPSRRAWKQLGQELAGLHRCRAEQYGWEADNFIGPLPQRNGPTHSWPEFWREQRLRPQLESAATRLGGAVTSRAERLLESLDDRLGVAQQDGVSLLHGDLWSGNVQFTEERAVLFDPACSYGHREVDLAMAALFGGFPAEFRSAYESAWPLLRGAADRIPIYQLYYLLVHVNLFGGGYIAQTAALLERIR